jgi:predicted membrane protein
MTTSSASLNATTTAPSRTPLLAALGIAAAAVLTAVGTFWDVNNNDAENGKASEWLICLGIIAVTAAVGYGLVVRTAETGNPGRRAVILGVVAFLSNAVFWAGLPMVLASAAVACAFIDKDKRGSFGGASKAGLVLAVLTAIPAVSLAIFG